MIYSEKDFNEEVHRKAMAKYIDLLLGKSNVADSELSRPGPKSAAQTPAPPKERIKGSKENPEGTAATRSKAGDIEISEASEQALKDKIAEFKKDHPNRKTPSLGTLKKVFRRGAGAFSTSFRPTITGGKPNSRNAWAMARVNKFLKMAGGGEVKESYRKADGDLLEERFEDCGTGAGGFKPGNTCAGGEKGDGEKEILNKQKAEKIKRIEQEMQKAGLSSVQLPNNENTAKSIKDSFDGLRSKGYEIPPPNQISVENLVNENGKDYQYVSAVAKKNNKGETQIVFNKEFDGNKIQEKIKNGVNEKWISSEDVFAHEYAHHSHIQIIGGKKANDFRINKWDSQSFVGSEKYKSIETAAKVSQYATKNPLEFVAETFAGHQGGKKYTDDVYSLYFYLDGPELKGLE